MSSLTEPAPAVNGGSAAAARKPRKKPARSLRLLVPPSATTPGVLQIVEGKAADLYRLTPLAADGPPAFQVEKFSDADPTGTLAGDDGTPSSYAVRLPDADGKGGSCECKGHLRHGHKTRCRHLAALLKLRELRLI
jgi:hypothetical protein